MLKLNYPLSTGIKRGDTIRHNMDNRNTVSEPQQTAQVDYYSLYINNALSCAQEGKYYAAIDWLDKAIKFDSRDASTRWWYYFFKSQWFSQLPNLEEALKTVDIGIKETGSPVYLMQQKAYLVLRKDKDYDQAIRLIDHALQIIESNAGQIISQLSNVPTQFGSIMNVIRDESDLKSKLLSLRIDAVGVRAELLVQNHSKTLELRLDKERTSTVELLAIFTAIMALIIVGGTFVTKLALRDAVWLISVLAVVLMGFISYTSFSFDPIVHSKKNILKLIDYRIGILFLSFTYMTVLILFLSK